MMQAACANNVLVADDEKNVTRFLLAVLAKRGIHGQVARDGADALRQIETRSFDMVFTDMKMPEVDGFRVLHRAKEISPEMPVVMITGYGGVEAAVRAMRAGCDDYVVKPLSPEQVEGLIETYLPNHSVPQLAKEIDPICAGDPIVGASEALRRVFRVTQKAARTSAPILIEGESGTGKELIARLLHKLSARSRAEFVRVNCAALSESLLESELFGHERGAFTGAYVRRKGRFERAHCGTLLLDEITETSPRFQAELLRVLEQQDFERLGGTEPIRVDVRVISTTNRDLAARVRDKQFRADLFYRLSGVRVTLPPLRERAEDIEGLVWHFVNLFAREARRHITELDREMLSRFRNHGWPGNIRQLRNVVRAALILGEGETLSLQDESLLAHPSEDIDEPRDLATAERRLILKILRESDGNRTRAAKQLGITDRTLRTRLAKYRQDGHFSDEKGED